MYKVTIAYNYLLFFSFVVGSNQAKDSVNLSDSYCLEVFVVFNNFLFDVLISCPVTLCICDGVGSWSIVTILVNLGYVRSVWLWKILVVYGAFVSVKS